MAKHGQTGLCSWLEEKVSLNCIRKMKYLVPIILWLASAASACAQKAEVLVVHLRTGGTIAYALNERPSIRHDATDVVITGEQRTVTFARSEVARLTFEATAPSGVVPVRTEGERPTFRVEDNVLWLSCLAAGGVVALYAVDGRLLRRDVADERGDASFVLPSTARAFVVKTPVATFKVMRK